MGRDCRCCNQHLSRVSLLLWIDRLALARWSRGTSVDSSFRFFACIPFWSDTEWTTEWCTVNPHAVSLWNCIVFNWGHYVAYTGCVALLYGQAFTVTWVNYVNSILPNREELRGKKKKPTKKKNIHPKKMLLSRQCCKHVHCLQKQVSIRYSVLSQGPLALWWPHLAGPRALCGILCPWDLRFSICAWLIGCGMMERQGWERLGQQNGRGERDIKSHHKL